MNLRIEIFMLVFIGILFIVSVFGFSNSSKTLYNYYDIENKLDVHNIENPFNHQTMGTQNYYLLTGMGSLMGMFIGTIYFLFMIIRL